MPKNPIAWGSYDLQHFKLVDVLTAKEKLFSADGGFFTKGKEQSRRRKRYPIIRLEINPIQNV
jgi:hypothetical protein